MGENWRRTKRRSAECEKKKKKESRRELLTVVEG
jgi:hypothetical protein